MGGYIGEVGILILADSKKIISLLILALLVGIKGNKQICFLMLPIGVSSVGHDSSPSSTIGRNPGDIHSRSHQRCVSYPGAIARP